MIDYILVHYKYIIISVLSRVRYVQYRTVCIVLYYGYSVLGINYNLFHQYHSLQYLLAIMTMYMRCTGFWNVTFRTLAVSFVLAAKTKFC